MLGVDLGWGWRRGVYVLFCAKFCANRLIDIACHGQIFGDIITHEAKLLNVAILILSQMT